MRVPGFVGRTALALAGRLRGGRPGGVIINGHSLTARQTRLQIETLGHWFEFIHHDDLLERLGRRRARPFCLLTFDDGKRSFATEIAPELERLGVPAVCYVVTRFLTEGAPLWFDRLEALVRVLGHTPRGLEPETLKRLPHAVLHERLDRACAEHRVAPDMQSDHVGPMSWDDARRLHRRGFTIGAHSLRHSILPRETEQEALADIAQCIAEVSAEIEAPCATFAFPNGNYTAPLAQHAVQCGVRTVVTTEPMWADARFPPWRLPRIQLFGEQGRSEIELKLAAAVGRVLANPDGTGRRYRQTGASGVR